MLPVAKLLNGVEIPVIGQGTYPMQGKALGAAMLEALRCGCKLIDTAHSYPNEDSIGYELHKIFRSGEFSRQDVFITSKIGDKLDHGMPMQYYFYNSDSCVDRNHRQVVCRQVEESMKKLRVEYIDLLLIHWPYYDCLEEIWDAMCELYRQGVVRAVGVSNCKARHIQRIQKSSDIVPMVNQLYFSPLNTQKEAVEYCQQLGIVCEAYSPLMFLRRKNELTDSAAFRAVCDRYGKSPAQVVLRWNIQKGVVPIPKAASSAHIRANYDVFDFNLAPSEMALINSFNCDHQYLVESLYCPGY